MRIDASRIRGGEQAGDRGFHGGERSAKIVGDGVEQRGFETLTLALGFRLAELLDSPRAFDSDGHEAANGVERLARQTRAGNSQTGDGTDAQTDRYDIERLLRLDRRFVAHEYGLHAFFVEVRSAKAGAVKLVFLGQE